MVVHVPGHLVVHGIEEGTVVVIDYVFGVVGGVRGVVEVDGLLFVGGLLLGEFGVVFGEEGFVRCSSGSLFYLVC